MLLNENRHRIPLVDVAPVDGEIAYRGEMKMLVADGDTNLYVCTTQGLDEVAATLTLGVGDAAVDFTAVDTSVAGNDVSVEFLSTLADQDLSVSVLGNVITVELEVISGVNSSTATEVAAAINAFEGAALLVSAVAGGNGTGLVADAAETNLSGGGTTSVWTTHAL